MTDENQTVETINVTMEVGKESKDVVDVLAELINDVKEGKKLEALSENMTGLIAAFEGYQMLDDEQKHESMHGTRAYMVMKLSEALVYKPIAV